jgi:hypothetical protein
LSFVGVARVIAARLEPVVRASALRGYLLEEALAWLLRGSGYRLLTDATGEPELIAHGQELLVRGRGAAHQVDVLGELLFTPAFSLPIRLFLEAKFAGRMGLSVVRNAHGVVFDVNENYVPRAAGKRPERRYRYTYALFSTGGFTADAQQYAIAHQISLIDLSGPKFAWLRDPIEAAADHLHVIGERQELKSFPVGWMRGALRVLLETALSNADPESDQIDADYARAAFSVLVDLAGALTQYADAQLLLGFPAAPFILALGSEDVEAFAAYADQYPTHDVHIRRIGSGTAGQWILYPAQHPEAYELAFNMPAGIEEWVAENEERRVSRTRLIKDEMLSTITIYGRLHGHERVHLLRYAPAQLRQLG